MNFANFRIFACSILLILLVLDQPKTASTRMFPANRDSQYRYLSNFCTLKLCRKMVRLSGTRKMMKARINELKVNKLVSCRVQLKQMNSSIFKSSTKNKENHSGNKVKVKKFKSQGQLFGCQLGLVHAEKNALKMTLKN
jgi:hypothetical protein